jgi:hypothetical protein
MRSPFTNLDFERFVYRHGQLLASSDFCDQQRMEAARRWMHNSAIHNAWGVAVGFEFSLSGTRPQSWDAHETVTIHPGIAYDCFGRELILTKEVKFSRDIFEDEQGGLKESLRGQKSALVLRYQESGMVSTADSCFGSRHSAAFPPPLFLWKPSNEVCFGPDVPILLVSFTNVALVQRYFASRARPQARPKIASGQTVPGQTAWQEWVIPQSLPVVLGLQVSIDTREAGFQQTPCYFAWLNGPLPVTLGGNVAMLEPFASLAKETPTGFIFRILLADFLRAQVPTVTLNPTAANRQKLALCWLGIEHAGVAS